MCCFQRDATAMNTTKTVTRIGSFSCVMVSFLSLISQNVGELLKFTADDVGVM